MLTYHRVLEADLSRFPLYPDVVDVGPDAFDQQMEFVSRNFKPLLASEIASMIGGDRRWPRHPVAITFDDGYSDNVTTALPILQKHGLRATFFVTAGAVENRELFWWDYISYVVAHCLQPCLRISYPAPAAFRTDTPEARRSSAESLINMVKLAADVDLTRLKETLAEASGVEVPEAHLCGEHVATWEGVRSLVEAGMEVGSHTLSHRILSSLSPSAMTDELGHSKSCLEERLGVEVTSLAYPGGGLTADVCRAVSAAGYRVAFGPAGPAGRVSRAERFSVRRQSIGRDEPFELFCSMLMIPALFTQGGHYEEPPLGD